MNLILYFYLIHFLADYPFQPNELVKLKHKSYYGVFMHCLVHLATLITLLLPFLYSSKVWIAIGVIFATHNIIDQAKVYLDKKYPKRGIALYFGDQIAHLVIVTTMAMYVGTVIPDLSGVVSGFYSNQSVILYFLILVLVTYFYDVTRYFIMRKRGKLVYKRNYKTIIWNATITTVAFVVYWMSY